MRTPSQLFATALQQNEIEKSVYLIKTYGLEKTHAFFYIMMFSSSLSEWETIFKKYAFFQQKNIQQLEHSLLFSLTNNEQWSNPQNYSFLRWMLSFTEPQWYQEKSPFHHAAYHGNHNAFLLLLEDYTSKFHQPFDFNSFNKDKTTPLYLSLLNKHLDTSVEILLAKGTSYCLMPNPSNPKETLSVLECVYKHTNYSQSIKTLWQTIHEKALLIENTQQKNLSSLSLSHKRKI